MKTRYNCMRVRAAVWAIILAIVLSSCGFSPIYESRGRMDMSAETRQIAISPVKGFDGPPGVDLRNRLMNRLTPAGRPDNPLYALDITMSRPLITEYTIRNDGTASSYLVRIRVDYELRLAASREVLLRRNASSEVSYNILKDQYSTEMLRMGAIKMVVEDLADQIYLGIITWTAGK